MEHTKKMFGQVFTIIGDDRGRAFVLGIKEMAWKKAVDQTKFEPADLQNYSRFTTKLNKALNDSIENTLRDLLVRLDVAISRLEPDHPYAAPRPAAGAGEEHETSSAS